MDRQRFPVGVDRDRTLLPSTFRAIVRSWTAPRGDRIGERLLWLPSNVGYFADGRIWPLPCPRSLRLGFLPIPIDPRRPGDGILSSASRLEAVESVNAASWLRGRWGSRL